MKELQESCKIYTDLEILKKTELLPQAGILQGQVTTILFQSKDPPELFFLSLNVKKTTELTHLARGLTESPANEKMGLDL